MLGRKIGICLSSKKCTCQKSVSPITLKQRESVGAFTNIHIPEELTAPARRGRLFGWGVARLANNVRLARGRWKEKGIVLPPSVIIEE